MTHATRRWSYSTGERGRNRVRAFAHPETGRLFLELYDHGARRRIALGHTDRDAAKQKAEEVATALRRDEAPVGPALTLQALFDNYGSEVTPQKAVKSQAQDRRATSQWLQFLGPDRTPASLTRRDWDGFIRWRAARGDRRTRKGPGRGIGPRTLQADLRFLVTVLNWAVRAGLLDRNPLLGCPWPRAVSPKRPILNDGEYQALLCVARAVDPRFALALVLAHETGHRIGAVRRLRWSDVDLAARRVQWRAETDKIGFEHVTPLSAAAVAALEQWRREHPTVGAGWLLPAPGDLSQPCSVFLLGDWWRRAESLAGLPRVRGRGWHSLRRKFASELRHLPLRDLCDLGGWKEPQTVLKCYQQADEQSLAAGLRSRRARIDTTIDTMGPFDPKQHARRAS